ncbi:MAG: hypothetical protein ACI8X3_002690 [Saprospiraceae bacterium]|jgi:hypothetical protein
MAYDEFLADRIRQIFKEKKVDYFGKKMFNGLCFMVDEKMCCGIHFDKKKDTDLLMARIGEEASIKAMEREGCQPMDFTGRPMKGYVFVRPEGFDTDDDLAYWLQLCVDFNPLAKASKKKKPAIKKDK